ncbi:hypothetical protein D9611_006927 [Ephemerocybe angulata]|uniref:Uncharacterized protein n=1 Tax=Ephemerocybe angulata TaxID=980116 RepID=A0A8H5AZR0_9AGAR|nr:hypothetical protein D9611_006927 [Tulosesus angulatus]
MSISIPLPRSFHSGEPESHTSHMQGRWNPRARTLSMCSTSSSAASSAYSVSRAPTAILTSLPKALPDLDTETSEFAWGAFAPSSHHRSGLGASTTLLRFVQASPGSSRTPAGTGASSSSKGTGTRPVLSNSFASEKRVRKSVKFNLQPLVLNAAGSARSKSPLSSSPPAHGIMRAVKMAPSPSSSDSSASSSRSPSPGRGGPESDDDDVSPSTHLLHPTSTALHPVLARVERSSKFCAGKMVCATCSKPGRDYPACGKCQKMWCSRECRLQGGKRHIC